MQGEIQLLTGRSQVDLLTGSVAGKHLPGTALPYHTGAKALNFADTPTTCEDCGRETTGGEPGPGTPVTCEDCGRESTGG